MIVSCRYVPAGLRLAHAVIVGRNVAFESAVELAQSTWIGDGVTLGHPRSSSIRQSLTRPDSTFAGRPVTVGAHTIIRSGCVIYEGVRIGEGCEIAHNVLVREDSEVGPGCYVMPNSEIHAQVRIGRGTRIHGFVCNRATIEDGASMLGMLVHDYRARGGGVIENPPYVCRDAVIGMNAVVIGGITVGEGAYVGAGAVVTHDVAAGATVLGNPARVRTEGMGFHSTTSI